MKIDTRYSLAVLVLALLGAGCANEPQQTGQAAAVQPAKVAATSPAAPFALYADDPLECWYLIPAGSVVHKWVCFNASEVPPVAAKDDDPVECEIAGMTRNWRCTTASEKADDEALARLRSMEETSSASY